MEINLSPDELEILNWLHVRVRGFGENYFVKVSDLLTATELSPENYEKAISLSRNRARQYRKKQESE